MDRSLYLDSSLWSRLVEPPVAMKRRVTQAFVRAARRRFRLLVSPLVVEELSRTKDDTLRAALLATLGTVGPEIVEYGTSPEEMGRELLSAGRWRESRLADTTHIAYTLLSEAEALVTWDTDDLARDRTRTVLQAYAMRKGLRAPLIGTPHEVSEWLGIRIA